MLSKALNLITLQYSKLIFFQTIISCSWLMWRAIIYTVLYDKNTLFSASLSLDDVILDIKWCVWHRGLTVLSLSLHMHCWCCFQPVLLCVQHMSLTCHGISDSISNHLYHKDTSIISPSVTLCQLHSVQYTEFEMHDEWEKDTGLTLCKC